MHTPSTMFAMGSVGHLALNLGLVALLATMIAFRRQLPALRRSRSFMAGTAALVLGLEVLSYVLKLGDPATPAFELLPFQLCSSLKFAITLLILFERYDAVRYLSVLAIGCGLISFANLNLHGETLRDFTFWHYAIGHYYLFAAPLFLFLCGEHRVELRTHLRMKAGLGLWSFFIFVVNWALDTNYMYTGPHNDTVVPFLPASMMQWPFNYVSYVLIALVLLNVTYGILRVAQRAPAPAPSETSNAPVAHAGVAVG
ncbi:MAG: YwaF family protein [Myxococcaceae bacterium]|nr:YwaF family protein [Myxococcaceae bacterium]